MIDIIIFIFILGVLVLIHELGHFIAAKKNGVKVEEFGFGFPPRLWGIKRGETLYSVNLIPIGGFVKVFGEEYQEKDKKQISEQQKKHTFIYKKPWQKVIILLAGVIMNVLLAILIYYGLLLANNFQSDPLPLFNNYSFKFGSKSIQVAAQNIIPDSPAAKVNIQSGDIILRYRLKTMTSWEQINGAKELINIIKARKDEPVTLGLKNIHDGKTKTVTVYPQYDNKLKRAVIGVNLVDLAVISYQKPIEKLTVGFLHSYNILEYNYKTIASLVSISIQEKTVEPVSQAVSGPIGIFAVIHEVVKTSGPKLISNLLNVMAMISLSLGFINILPLPALDGGRLVFVIYEWLTGKRANATIEKYVNIAGIILLLTLALLTTVNDLIKFTLYFSK